MLIRRTEPHLHITSDSLGEGGTFSTELQPKTRFQIYEKFSIEDVSCHFCQTSCWVAGVIISTRCFLLLLKHWEIFKPIFCVGIASSLAKFGFERLACATLTMCLQLTLAILFLLYCFQSQFFQKFIVLVGAAIDCSFNFF